MLSKDDLCKAVSFSPTNHSKSKMQFSFPRTRRFNSFSEAICDNFYCPPIKQGRSTTFGYGRKHDFTHGIPKSPSPNQYDVSASMSPKKGFNFGSGRENMIVTGPLAKEILNKNPGPGSYNSEAQQFYKSKGYSIRKKTSVVDTWKTSNPGPGAYDHKPTLNGTGEYFQAKYKNSGASVIGRDEGKKLKEGYSLGPGAYEFLPSINAQGRYVPSNKENTVSRHFCKAKRETLEAFPPTPGPGGYNLPSEFCMNFFPSNRMIANLNPRN